MKKLAFTLAAAAVAVLGDGVRADPVTHHLDELVALVNGRTGTTAAETKALAAAKKALAKESTGRIGDVAMAASVVKILDKAFPADAAVKTAADDTILGFVFAVGPLRTALVADIAAATDGKAKTAAQKQLAAADVVIAANAASTTHKKSFAAISTILKDLDKGEHALPAKSFVAAFVDGDPFVPDPTTISADFDTNSRNTFLIAADTAFDSGAPSTSAHVFINLAVFPHKGTTYDLYKQQQKFPGFPLVGYGRYDHSGNFVDGGERLTLHPGAKIKFTKVDTKNRVVEGTFSFVANVNGNAAKVDTVAGGSFHLTYTLNRN